MKRTVAALLGGLAFVLNAGTVVAQEGGEEGGQEALIYILAVGAPITVTFLFLAYVYVSEPIADAEGENPNVEGQTKMPQGFDYEQVGNQLVVTYEGANTWDREGLSVRYEGENGEVLKSFDTKDGKVTQGDGLSVNTDAVYGKVEVVWDGEVVDEYVPEG